jgi:hypothetical protein
LLFMQHNPFSIERFETVIYSLPSPIRMLLVTSATRKTKTNWTTSF